jgi:hypothetical protein
MKNLLKTLALVLVVFIVGCKKDDFVPVVGVCPVVLSTSPENNATGVALNQVVRVTFNTRMDQGSINQQSFTLRGPGLIAGTIIHTDSTASFTPSSLLAPNTTYTGTLTTMVKDITGNAMQQNYVWTFVTGPTIVEFNSLNRFGVFAATGIANLGNSQISNMDIGVGSNRNTVTGFPPGEIFNGNIYAMDDGAGTPAILTLAKTDFDNSYQNALSLNSPSRIALAGDQGGKLLTPGIYNSNGNLSIQSGNLILDARNDVNAVWIFQINGNLNTLGSQGGNIVLANGAKANNVFWVVENSATLGAGTTFIGNLLANNSISLNSGANVTGRLLSKDGSVSLSSNVINKP